MSDVSIPTAKSALRREMKAALRTQRVPPPAMHGQIAAWLRTRPDVRRVALFAPLPGEPDLLPLLREMPDHVWCFPRVIDHERLTFHEVKDAEATLRPAAFGLREPIPDAPAVPIATLDAFLCPGLAFDGRGGRLGRGRGYYDRMLAGARADAAKVGVCFTCQLVESTFNEPHDVRMDVVVCESGPARPVG